MVNIPDTKFFFSLIQNQTVVVTEVNLETTAVTILARAPTLYGGDVKTTLTIRKASKPVAEGGIDHWFGTDFTGAWFGTAYTPTADATPVARATQWFPP